MKIAIAQLNPTVGDLDGNLGLIFDAYLEAANNGAELVIAPECVLTGYPLEDLVMRPSFMTAVKDKVEEVHQFVRSTGFTTSLIFGTPFPVADLWYEDNESEGVNNVAVLIDPTVSPSSPTCDVEYISKYELPNYGVFDEKRIFKRSALRPHAIRWRKYTLGLMVCEDAWFPTVSNELKNDGAKILISINGSPYEIGKNVTRRQVVADRIKQTGLPFIYVNLVGGQDELVFDGGSFAYDGKTVQEAPQFQSGVFMFDIDIEEGNRQIQDGKLIAQVQDNGEFSWWSTEPRPIATLDNFPIVEPTGIAEIYQACVTGTRDYLRKQGFSSAIIGYSGGVDSGIVAAIAADAIGADHVHLVRLPSKFSSDGSLDDAQAGAIRLGAQMRTISIEPVVDALRAAYVGSKTDGSKLVGVADENIQARARGVILMAISNQEGHILLTTGNKSEVSVGYSTLYGDMSGGFNPIKDCYKVTVWELCRWRNSLTLEELKNYGFLGRQDDVVPEEIIVKPPSAELRENQKDEDSLPPYPVLDAMLKAMIEDELSVPEIAEKLALEIEQVHRIRRLVDNAEYKRRQAAPGVKITSKIHGRDRRYPIVNKWRG